MCGVLTESAVAVCGGEVSGPSGTLRSHNETALVSALTRPLRVRLSDPTCEWVITVRRGRTILVTIQDINIQQEAGDGQGPASCGNGYLLVSSSQ